LTDSTSPRSGSIFFFAILLWVWLGSFCAIGFGWVRFARLGLVQFVLHEWVWFSSFCMNGFGSVRFAQTGLVQFVLHGSVWFALHPDGSFVPNALVAPGST
jgi:hypothetical protein